ncbi:MAG: hypothetical protein ACK55I_02285, partial [bacterium]
FNNAALTLGVGQGKVLEPVMGIHTITTAGTTSPVTFTSIWFTASCSATARTTHDSENTDLS